MWSQLFLNKSHYTVNSLDTLTGIKETRKSPNIHWIVGLQWLFLFSTFFFSLFSRCFTMCSNVPIKDKTCSLWNNVSPVVEFLRYLHEDNTKIFLCSQTSLQLLFSCFLSSYQHSSFHSPGWDFLPSSTAVLINPIFLLDQLFLSPQNKAGLELKGTNTRSSSAPYSYPHPLLEWQFLFILFLPRFLTHATADSIQYATHSIIFCLALNCSGI
jgi:hypothetical protein